MFYIDSSALLKSVMDEPESDDFRAWIHDNDPLFVSSDIVKVEFLRAVRRQTPDHVAHARHVLRSVAFNTVSEEVLGRAEWLSPPAARSLDALHIATALSIADDVDALVTYDKRMAECAEAHGFFVVAPGA